MSSLDGFGMLLGLVLVKFCIEKLAVERSNFEFVVLAGIRTFRESLYDVYDWLESKDLVEISGKMRISLRLEFKL